MPIVEDPAELDSHELVAESSDIPIKRETLDIHVGRSEDGGSWRLITSTRLDTDESVLDDVDPPDTVLTPEGIKGVKHVNSIGVSLVAVRKDGELDRETLFELDCDLVRGVRGGFGRLGQLPHIGRRSDVGILEDTGLIRNVEHVLVRGPWLGGSLADWDLLLGSIFEQRLTTSESVVKLWVRRLRQYATLRKNTASLPGILHGAMTLMSGFNP